MVPRQPNHKKKHTSLIKVFYKTPAICLYVYKTSGWDFNLLSFTEVSYLRLNSHLCLVPTKKRLAVKLRRIQQDINNLGLHNHLRKSEKDEVQNSYTLQGTNISHLGKRKIIFKMPFWGDMLVPWRVIVFGRWKNTSRPTQLGFLKVPQLSTAWDSPGGSYCHLNRLRKSDGISLHSLQLTARTRSGILSGLFWRKAIPRFFAGKRHFYGGPEIWE